MILEATAVCGKGVRGHPTTSDVAIETEIARGIGRLNTTAGAGAEAGAIPEAPRDVIDHHSMEGRRAKK